ncbi:MSC_0623 family F1-like ATPase-associated protein [Mycoplasma sp. Ms02]|uniref:MSC_0623 family F1-like ATPase-associated protein n=1 Tax=Mycoplasma sp. Ms02 TaxID=353851 RepID=UPI001C8A57B1|nr:DUF2714 domain-containing protein [Mycoplasma sp. Ms02]QZE12323.1 DUF2714 domain-containing protein [Mycoplasma sp. Ms02]
MKLNKKNKEVAAQQSELQKKLYEVYNRTLTSPDFVSSQMFNNQIELVLSSKENKKAFSELMQKLLENTNAKNEIVLEDFIISFTRVARFSFEDLVPVTTKSLLTNVPAFYAKSLENDSEATKYVKSVFWNLLHELTVKQDLKVEAIPGLIIYFDKNDNLYKLIFSETFVKQWT